MSVRFNRQGTGVVNDHNDLAHKGVHTHAEIDQYLDELDVARGTNPSLDARLDGIDQKDATQDSALTGHGTRIGDLETSQGNQEDRLVVAEGKITNLETELHTARGTYPNLDARLDALPTSGGGGSGVTTVATESDLPATGVANSLYLVKADSTSGGNPTLYVYDSVWKKIAGGGGGGSGGSPVAQAGTVYHSATSTRIAAQREFIIGKYQMGKNQLMVFLDGFLVLDDYTETNDTTITFGYDIQPEVDVVVVIGSIPYVDSLAQSNTIVTGASTGNPVALDIMIPVTTDFKLRQPAVLKFMPGQNDMVKTQSAFAAGESSKFEPSSDVIFDGNVHPITSLTQAMVNEGALGSGTMYSVVIDFSRYNKIEKVEVM